jgi:hypothetical protein
MKQMKEGIDFEEDQAWVRWGAGVAKLARHSVDAKTRR